MTWEELKQKAKEKYRDDFECDMNSIVYVGSLKVKMGKLFMTMAGTVEFIREYEDAIVKVDIAVVDGPDQMWQIMEVLK